ncbi:MAG: response regulator [Gemmatimonadetes bacterium]|nr:response regulator [Gemmatimonadota bacterium]
MTCPDAASGADSVDTTATRLAVPQERYARAARAGMLGVWDWEVESDTFYVDSNLLAMLGHEQMSGPMNMQEYSALVHPDDVDEVVERVRQCVRIGEGDLSIIHRKLHRDGSVRWFLSRGEVQRDTDGHVRRLVGSDMDITELKMAQDALYAAKGELEGHVAERTTQLERANRQLRVQMAAREQSDSHREAVLLLRQRVWHMQDPADMDTVLEAVEASLEIADVDYEQYGINLLVKEEDGPAIRQSLKTSQGEWAYRDSRLAKPERLLRFVTQGRVVYRKDLRKEDPFGDSSWAVQPNKEYRSVIDVPFAYGTLALNSFEPGAFDDAQVGLFGDLAEVLAEGMQRARDLQDLADRNHLLEQQLAKVREREAEVQDANARLAAKDLLLAALHDITTAVHQEAEESSVLDRFARQLLDMGMFRSLVLAVVDDQRHTVRVERSLWRSKRDDGEWQTITTAPEKVGVEYDIDEPNVTAEVARTGRMIVIEGWDDRFDERFTTREKAAHQVAYFIPIIYLGQVTAVLATGSNKDQRQDVLGVLEDLRPVLDHFAIALHHARLYRLISERERQLRVAQKMDEMGQLTSGIAHNFNNLLQGVIGNLSLVLEDCDESLKAPLEDALRSSRSQAELVRQLMAYARRGPQPERTAIDVERLLDAVTKMCRQVFAREIEFHCVVAANLPAVEGDATQLEQVLLNLCLNARDAVEALRERAPRIDVVADLVEGVGDTNDVVRVSVRDSGRGMSDDVRERVFDPFFTTKEPGKGTGLGLSIVQGVVQQHGGRVECDSREGEGTTMTMFLPVSTGEPANDVDDPPAKVDGDEFILIVEDEPMIRDVVGRILRRHGYTVTMAVNGADGLEQIAASGDIDLVLLDLSMPIMSGEDMLTHLADIRPDLPVIVFTGFGDLRQRTGQVAALLPKPVRPMELLRTIRSTLDS